LLDQVLPVYPDDPWLKSTRGYSYKNESMALRRLGRIDEADEALSKADRVFSTMADEDPDDASAWNGQGSVAALRGDLQVALELIDKALELDPSYEVAWHDRQQLLPRIGQRAFSVSLGDRVAFGGDAGTVVAEGMVEDGPRVLVQWDD
jgi:tetratricopeptide (TPR) repeat protein